MELVTETLSILMRRFMISAYSRTKPSDSATIIGKFPFGLQESHFTSFTALSSALPSVLK